MTRWFSVAPQVLWFIVFAVAAYLTAKWATRRRRPTSTPTRQVRATLTGPIHARLWFAYSVALDSADRAQLLFGSITDTSDAYLVTIEEGESLGWFTGDAEMLGLQVVRVEDLADRTQRAEEALYRHLEKGEPLPTDLFPRPPRLAGLQLGDAKDEEESR
ncbi:MAG: hypothetical protein ACYC5Y_05125 [Symbiobacteriia bacterium]